MIEFRKLKVDWNCPNAYLLTISGMNQFELKKIWVVDQYREEDDEFYGKWQDVEIKDE